MPFLRKHFWLAQLVALVVIFSPLTSATAQPLETPNEGGVCKATKAMSQEELGKFHAYVINVDTGEVLIDVNGLELTPSGSVMKVLTAVAALEHIEEGKRAVTSLYSIPDNPGVLVLKGGGDFTLSRLQPGESSVYSKPPRLRTLVEQALEVLPADFPITKILLDTSYFSGDSWNQDWPKKYRSLGYVSKITALQMDGDRIRPNRLSSSYSFKRSQDPVMTSGMALKEQLGEIAIGAELETGILPENAVEIASVQSQEIRKSWIKHMLTYSDNTAAEFIARHSAIEAGLGSDILAAQKILKSSIREIGLKPKRFIIRDASGLSAENRVHAKLLAKLMVKVAKGEYGLDPLIPWLPVAGETGTLRYRFQGKAAIARGKVFAKTGYIPGLYGLSGLIDAVDGSKLAFAVFAKSDKDLGVSVTYTAQRAIDRVIARFYSCGASLGQ